MAHIALLDDDDELRHLVSDHLRAQGYAISDFRDGNAMWREWSPGRWDLYILDVMLPGEDGLTLARRLREKHDLAPILMLTARSDETDRVVGLEVGADDYMAKPFGPRELVARVRALLRRARLGERQGALSRIRFDRWTLDTVTRQIESNAGLTVALSGIEYKLLAFLLEHPGRVRSRDEIMKRLHGRDADPYNRSIDLLVGKLRQKLGDDARDPRLIKTVRGEGYVLSTRASDIGDWA
jgi:two-component system OmpR family response regulator